MRGMGLNFHKLNDTMQLSVIVAMVFAVLVGWIPNYESLIYSQTKPVEWFEAKSYAGYPAGDGVPELESRAEVIKEGAGFTLAVDAGTIKPLHIFVGLSRDTVTKSAYIRFVYRDDDRNAFGQFFSVELKNGDTMIVLLDDYAVNLPRNGTVKLPIGETKRLLQDNTIEYLTEEYDFSEDELAYYIDMAGSWRKSRVAERIVTVRVAMGMAAFVIAVIGTYVLIRRIERKEECEQGRRRQGRRG